MPKALPTFLKKLADKARSENKPESIAWPQEPTKNDDGNEVWESTCDRYRIKRQEGKVRAYMPNGIILDGDCKGVVSAMITCSKHLAKQLRQQEIPTLQEIRQETERVVQKQVQIHGKHRRSQGGTVASKIADRLRRTSASNPVSLSELAQINVDSTGADMAKATRNTLWYLGHMLKGDRGMPLIQWIKRGDKYHV